MAQAIPSAVATPGAKAAAKARDAEIGAKIAL
jgi:hypothetical protein